MTVAQIIASQETADSILEDRVIPGLDRIILEYGHTLTIPQLDDIRRFTNELEGICSELQSA